MNFIEQVRAMTGKEIIMAMVNGLKNEHVKINMGAYLVVKKGVCYGCAATNAICEIAGRTPNVRLDDDSLFFRVCDVMGFSIEERIFIESFERAIDGLRTGNISFYNAIAKNRLFAELPVNESLPSLNTINWKDEIQHYIDFANTL